jgi:hypothetical protein
MFFLRIFAYKIAKNNCYNNKILFGINPSNSSQYPFDTKHPNAISQELKKVNRELFSQN